MSERLKHVPVLDEEVTDPQEKQPKVLTESEALRIAVERYEKRGGYHFPATRVRGVHPHSFTTEDIMGFTDDELHDFVINSNLLEAAFFLSEINGVIIIPDPTDPK